MATESWLVDADGTLWPVSPVERALRRLAAWLGGRCGRGGDDVYGLFAALQLDFFRGHVYLDAYEWEKIVSTVAADLCGPRAAEEAVNLLREYVREELAATEPAAGAAEALEYARANNIRVAVVSNGLSHYIEPILEATGLIEYVDAVVTPDKVDIYWAPPIKPHRPIFVYAMKQVPANKYTMIGNNVLFDCLGALRSGVDKAYVIYDPQTPSTITELYTIADTLDDEIVTLFDGSIRQTLLWYTRKIARVDLRLGECIHVKTWYDILRQYKRGQRN